MSKQHLEAVAKAIAVSPEFPDDVCRVRFAVHMAESIKQFNPRFDVRRFVRASVGQR